MNQRGKEVDLRSLSSQMEVAINPFNAAKGGFLSKPRGNFQLERTKFNATTMLSYGSLAYVFNKYGKHQGIELKLCSHYAGQLLRRHGNNTE